MAMLEQTYRFASATLIELKVKLKKTAKPKQTHFIYYGASAL